MKDITTEKFKLRPFRESDAIIFTNLINTKTIERDTTIKLPWPLEMVKWWITFINESAKRTPLTEFHFVIEVDGQLAGSIGVINIIDHRGEIGYWLADKYHKQGIMSEVVAKVIAYTFKNTNVSRIFAPVLPHNKGSAKVLEKNGFELEGTLKKYYKKNNKFIDALCYAKVK